MVGVGSRIYWLGVQRIVQAVGRMLPLGGCRSSSREARRALVQQQPVEKVKRCSECELSSRETALLTPTEGQVAELSAGPPILIVSVDTEAEFDWNGPFLRTHTSVRNLRSQTMAQEIFDHYGVRPIYLVDYAVATQSDGYMPLREISNT